MISPGINVNDNINALEIGICIMKPIMIVPNISNPNTPITSVAIKITKKLILCKYASRIIPIN